MHPDGSIQRLRNILRQPQVVAALTLGFSSGLPFNLSDSTLQAWAATVGIDIRTIGWMTMVTVPYTFKFLWAPVMDRWAPPILGRRRGWILLLQLLLSIAIVFLALSAPDKHLYAAAALGLVVAFLSASQDIVIDAYRTDTLRPEERGVGSALTQVGYRSGNLVSGALALMITGILSWQNVYLVMGFLMAMMCFATISAPEPEKQVLPPRTLGEAVSGPLRAFFAHKGALALLALIVLYKFGDAFAVKLLTAFLISGIGFSAFEVGAYSKTVLIIATLMGTLVGGALLARLSLWRALLLFGALQASTNLAFALLASAGKSIGILIFAIGFDSFAGGMGAVAFVALVMALCDRRFSAAQYALLSALAVMPRTFLGPLAAFISLKVGWTLFFGITFFTAFPGLILVWSLRKQIESVERNQI